MLVTFQTPAYAPITMFGEVTCHCIFTDTKRLDILWIARRDMTNRNLIIPTTNIHNLDSNRILCGICICI